MAEPATKYYVCQGGIYRGAFYGETGKDVSNWIEVSSPPDAAWWTWDFVNSVWIENAPPA